MEYLLRKSDAIPHPAGPVVMKATGRVYQLLERCRCSSPWLHYEVKNEKGEIMIVQHPEVEPLSK